MNTLDVFGVSNKEIATYIYREDVDGTFKAGLLTKNHIIIYGASKQGKTTLIKKHLATEEFIQVECSPKTETIDIYRSIIRQLGIKFKTGESIKKKDSGELKAGGSFTINIPILSKVKSSIESKYSKEKERSEDYNSVEYNLALAQDVSEILNAIAFKKKIVLENFHYLSLQVQKQLAFDLRTFHDMQISFIVIGIWKEQSRLIQFNGDLQDRVIEVPVEPWKLSHLFQIAKIGEELLNINFDSGQEDVGTESLVEVMYDDCFGSVGVFQELCKECCLAADIKAKSRDLKYISELNYLAAVEKKFEHYQSRHFRSFEAFVGQKSKRKDQASLYIPFYFIKMLSEEKNFEKIYQGIRRQDFVDYLRKNHHNRKCSQSDVSFFLHGIVNMQLNKGISPPIFDYDFSTKKVRIIDSTFYFYLRYFNNKNMIEELEHPLNEGFDEL